MNKEDLEFLLTEIHNLAFVNPFGSERDRTEERIVSRLGWTEPIFKGNPIFTKEFNQVLHWVRVGERALLDGMAKEFRTASLGKRMASLAYFSLYHEIVGDLDSLIEGPEGDSVGNRKIFRRIEEGIRKRTALIRGVSNPMWGNPGHLFSCFYQLRRAFLCLFQEIVGGSEPIRALRMRVWESVFTQDMLSYQQWMHESVGRFPTLVLGPSGSGKEIVARAIGLSRFIPYDSQTSQFASRPRDSFRPVNLSALSETLIESELFGHRQGSFTGAIRDHAGIFETAGSHGTVFLDEIGEVPESIQVKLLRLLQSGEFQAIGGDNRSFYEGKIIAATHRDLVAEMRAGRIREDFFYRLCGDQVTTVALHDILASSPDEIIGSVHYICRKLFGAEGARELASRVVDTLRKQVPQNYEWPGNFRELEQAVRNVIVRNEYVPVLKDKESNTIEAIFENTEVTLSEWSKTYARKAFENAGSYREAARRLKVDQRTLKKLVVS
jgi:DNA-binding NtrC family response regulator